MRKLVSYLLVCSILASCSTSNQVVSNKLFQKRKYQKGWYINSSKTLKKENREEQNAFLSEIKEEQNDTIEVNQNIVQSQKKEQTFEVKKLFQKKELANQEILYERVRNNDSKVDKRNLSSLVNEDLRIKSKVEKPRIKQSPPIDRSDRLTRILLALLGIGLILYLSLAPLAILVAVGKGESLRKNLIVWLVGVLILAISLFTFVLLGIFFTPAVIVMLFVGIAFIVIADIHALYIIYRGY